MSESPPICPDPVGPPVNALDPAMLTQLLDDIHHLASVLRAVATNIRTEFKPEVTAAEISDWLSFAHLVYDTTRGSLQVMLEEVAIGADMTAVAYDMIAPKLEMQRGVATVASL